MFPVGGDWCVDELPLRFVAGEDAMAGAEAKLKTVQAQIDALRELSAGLALDAVRP